MKPEQLYGAFGPHFANMYNKYGPTDLPDPPDPCAGVSLGGPPPRNDVLLLHAWGGYPGEARSSTYYGGGYPRGDLDPVLFANIPFQF